MRSNWQRPSGSSSRTLDKREEKILKMRFGIEAKQEYTLEEVGRNSISPGENSADEAKALGNETVQRAAKLRTFTEVLKHRCRNINLTAETPLLPAAGRIQRSHSLFVAGRNESFPTNPDQEVSDEKWKTMMSALVMAVFLTCFTGWHSTGTE